MASKDIKVINVGGKSYAVGLFWQPVQNEKDYLKEIKMSIATVVIGANLYCLKKGTSSQYGLGYTNQGQKKGMPSGASGIASALRDKSSALCVFRINEGWWFITIRNNLILSEEDTVYTDENDAKEAFSSMLSIPDWGYKVAPSSWNFEDTKEISASELLAKGQAVELKTIESNNKIILIILLIAGAGGWYYYKEDQKQKELERIAIERKRAEERRKAMEKPPVPPPPPPAPWESLVDISDMAKKCTILIVNSTATIPGWSLTDSLCVEKLLTSKWRRTFGTTGWIFEAQKEGEIPTDMILNATDSAYNTVVGILPIKFMQHTSSEPSLTQIEIQKKLSDIFQSIKINNFKLSTGKTTVKDTKLPSYIKNYPYTTFSFTDVAYRLPTDWVKLLDSVTSIEFTSIKWDNNNRRWSYEGKIYEYVPEEKKDIPTQDVTTATSTSTSTTPATPVIQPPTEPVETQPTEQDLKQENEVSYDTEK